MLPLAVALQMKRGAVIYRDAWFDKPPLVPAVYLLWGGAIGPVLRVMGALYVLLACWLGYAIGVQLWGRREGYLAAGLFAFFLTFDTHSAVLPLAADLLLLVPHLAAVLFAFRRQPLLSGIAAGIGFLLNAKAVFVLAACALFAWPSVMPLLAGFVLPNLIAVAWLVASGAFTPWLDQAWRWPALYANNPLVADPVWNGVVRTANWLGFHTVLAIGAAVSYWRERQWKFLVWAALCLGGVVLGWRFFPRYFFLLLPALVIMAARGLAVVRSRAVIAIALICAAIPLVRFGPRYTSLKNWGDLAMDRDSQEASMLALTAAKPDSTLYVWGYRPEIFVYTHLKPATRYLDSQALTGVPADRHLTQSTVVLTSGTHEAREELAASKPDILIDGLSLFNPALSMDQYPELRPFLSEYREIGRTRSTVIYKRAAMRR
ncbi:MAG: hypothetical protein QOJ99_2808 [Bryobacterales bacterium]|nr:hypothetical protein [Bryobacterales bacterium]